MERDSGDDATLARTFERHLTAATAHEVADDLPSFFGPRLA